MLLLFHIGIELQLVYHLIISKSEGLLFDSHQVEHGLMIRALLLRRATILIGGCIRSARFISWLQVGGIWSLIYRDHCTCFIYNFVFNLIICWLISVVLHYQYFIRCSVWVCNDNVHLIFVSCCWISCSLCCYIRGFFSLLSLFLQRVYFLCQFVELCLVHRLDLLLGYF